MPKQYAVYIMTNKYGTVLYTGITNNIIKRAFQHRQQTTGFTAKYKVTRLVYFELYEDVREAIRREKQRKGGSRKDKIALIKINNPSFRDLYEEIL